MTRITMPPPGPGGGQPDPDRIAAHLATVADVLHELATEIEDLGTTLCLDTAIIQHHVGTLQSIDLIAQKQRWLATLLQADCAHTAVSTIGVEALKARFASSNAH